MKLTKTKLKKALRYVMDQTLDFKGERKNFDLFELFEEDDGSIYCAGCAIGASYYVLFEQSCEGWMTVDALREVLLHGGFDPDIATEIFYWSGMPSTLEDWITWANDVSRMPWRDFVKEFKAGKIEIV